MRFQNSTGCYPEVQKDAPEGDLAFTESVKILSDNYMHLHIIFVAAPNRESMAEFRT